MTAWSYPSRSSSPPRIRRSDDEEFCNRRLFEQALRAELSRSARRHRPLGLLMIDLDRCKAINDRFGHAAGDQVLCDAAARLAAVGARGGRRRPLRRHGASTGGVARRRDTAAGASTCAAPGLPDGAGGPGARAGYGRSWLMRVYQLASAVRVAPQLPNGAAAYCVRVHVCPMYSEAIQTLAPSTTAAP